MTWSARAAASDLTSVNLDKIQRFRSAVDASNAPVTVLAFGDSMAESWQSVQKQVFEMLMGRAGTSGFAIQNAWNKLMIQASAGITWGSRNTNWWSYHYYVPPGEFMFWTNQSSATGSVVADEVGIFWVALPSGGDFRLSISTNGGPWTSLATLSGHSAEVKARHASFQLERHPYRLRMDSLSGTNVVLGPGFLDQATPGINIVFLAAPGVSLKEVLTGSTNLFIPVLQALSPRLVLWHMKEDLPELAERLDILEQVWKNGAPHADVVYLGTPWDFRDTNHVWAPFQNEIVRDAAIRHGRAYVDCMNPMVSYEWMVENGLMHDNMHQNAVGNQMLANILWKQLGFFALRRDRRLAVTPLDGGVRLEWAAFSDLDYEVQSSSDQRTWMPGPVIPGIDGVQTVTNTLEGTRFFRLNILPRN